MALIRCCRLFPVLFALMLSSVSVITHAHEFLQDGIFVGHPWTRATPPVEPVNAAVYLTIENRTDHSIRLASVSTPVTGQVSIHQTRESKGMTSMVAKKNGLKIAAGDTVRLEPMGYHLMLRNLENPLKKGDKFPLTLKFADGHTMKVRVTVGAVPDGGQM